MKTTPSKKWLKENISYAYFDEDLWLLLQNQPWREKLRNFIVEQKLTNF
jgi:putative restriction endonuclease